MHTHAAIFVYVLAAETAPEAVRLVRQTQVHNSNAFAFDSKQFSEITIVREHKRV